MITPTTFKESLHYKSDLSLETYAGLNSVFAAAVVNQNFREMLLRDPQTALDQGYLGKGFALGQAETSVILSAKASSLPELAKQVNLTLGR